MSHKNFTYYPRFRHHREAFALMIKNLLTMLSGDVWQIQWECIDGYFFVNLTTGEVK